MKKMSIPSGENKDLIENDGSLSKKTSESNSSMPNFNIKRKSPMRQLISAGPSVKLFSPGPNVKRAGSEIRQRVLSARQHRQKGLQNQLNVALKMNEELSNENRLLRTLQKRQDNALAKYESTASELPQLISSHADELRACQIKYRALSVEYRELNRKFQQKDKTLNELKDRIKHLEDLNAEKHLEEREVLKAKLEAMERKLDERDNEIRQLTRRNLIEAKNFKAQLTNERKKYKELCQKQNIEKTERKISSNDSDYSSAKDAKEYDSKDKSVNNASLSASSMMSHELPLNNSHANNVDNDDDVDLVIRRIIDESENSIGKIEDTSNDRIVHQMADIHLFGGGGGDMRNIQDIKRKIQKDIEKNEVLLDLHCDEISRDIDVQEMTKMTIDSMEIITANGKNRENSKMKPPSSNRMNRDEKANKIWNKMSTPPSRPPSSASTSSKSERPRESRPSSLPRFNINSSRQTQRTPIDPQKKTKLLAQLRSIEAANAKL